MALAVLPLGACVAEQSDGRQFANNPGSSTTVAVPSPPGLDPGDRAGLPSVATPIATPIDPVALLEARGGPSHFYVRVGSEVWSVAAAESEPEPRRVVVPERGLRLVDQTASPNGGRVAALLVGGNDETSTTVAIVGADGAEIGRVDDVGAGLGDGASVAQAIDWSPQGDRLLVAFAPGGLVALNADGTGEPTVLYGPEEAAAIGDVAWSPTGEVVAFVSPAESDEPASLFLAPTAPGSAAPTRLFDAAGSGRSVDALAWSPDGREIFFTLPSAPNSPTTGGDLWRIGLDGEDRRVVAGAGVVGFPGARIAEVAPAPDGDAVAYTILVPEQDGPRFNSLWVKERAEPARSVELKVPAGQAVAELWWTNAGLVFRTVSTDAFAADEGDGSLTLYRAGLPGRDPERLVATDGSRPATPAVGPGSPVTGATPEASPSG